MIRRPVPLVLAAALSLALTACSDDGEDLRSADEARPAPASSAAAAPTQAPTQPAPTQVATAAAPAPEVSSAATSPATSPAAPPPAAAAPDAPAAAPSTAAPGRAPAAAAAARPPSATVPGEYLYDASGSFSATGTPPRSARGTATLTADAPSGGRQLLVLDGDQGRTETDVALRADGRYLVRLTLTTPGFSEEFRPAQPVLLLPAPLVTGQTWEFTARSADGSTTVTARNRVTGDRTQTVGGTSVATAVVETVLAIRGDVVYDGTTTTDYEPQRGLPVRDTGSGRGTVNGVAFTTSSKSALRSLDPR